MDSESFIKKFRNTVDSIKVEAENIDYSILTHHVRLLDRIAMVENSSLTIFDMFQKKYVFVRNRFKNILLYNEEEASKEGFSYFFKLMHTEDVPMVVDTCTRALEFLNNITSEEKHDYKTIFEYRLKDRNGNDLRFLQQLAVLELDLKGNLWLILILNDICPNQQETKVFQRSMINIRTNNSIPFSDDDSTLSKRELEILGLLDKGMFSKEIADRLFISVNTVNNHRQNIIRKMGLSNTSEAISYARKIGIV